MKNLTASLILILLWSFSEAKAKCTTMVTVQDAISASTSDYLERAQKKAEKAGCDSIFLKINTPGGSLQTTRMIVEQILASPVPYVCLITPSGGHAGSAGAIILQACHVSGGLVATNVGAATPILMGGAETPSDLRSKIVNDTVSWLEGIAKLRGRSIKFSREIVTEAKAITSEEAVKEKALDLVAKSEIEFLQAVQGRKVLVQNNKTLAVEVGDLQDFSPDLRSQILSLVADPEFAYLLFMGSLGLLYVEITHPGMIAPGVIGGMGLVLSLVAFHKLQVVWGGLALIILGIIFLILEIFVPSFGALGIGGIVSVFVGSLFLFDTQATGYSLPLGMILSVVLVLAGFILGIGFLALKTIKIKTRDADADLRDNAGKVVQVEALGLQGQLEIMGETWNFVSHDPVELGDSVRVLDRHGLKLTIKKITKEE